MYPFGEPNAVDSAPLGFDVMTFVCEQLDSRSCLFLLIPYSKFPKPAGVPCKRNIYSKLAVLLLNIIDYFGVCFQL